MHRLKNRGKDVMKMSTRAAALLLAALPLTAGAQAKPDEWQWGATIYGWFPTISGKTYFPVTGGGPSIDVDADTILSNLKFVFMGTLEAQKGNWGVWTDVIYMDLGDSTSGTRDFTVGRRAIPADVSANLSYDIKSWVWTIAATYSLVNRPEYTLQSLVGARMIDVQQTLTWDVSGNVGAIGLPGRSGTKEISATNWDAIIGVKGRAAFGDEKRWFVPYYLDIGTGQSKFTWQGLIGVGYAFSWGSIVGAWRYLDYEFESGSPVESINFNGPAIGLVFRF
jgi:hypothetical protein